MPDWFKRHGALVGIFVVLSGSPSACSGRADVDVLDVSIQDEGMTLVVGVGTCNESSTEVHVIESEDSIVLTADTRPGYGCGGRDDCSDGRTIELGAPVGGRRIVDGSGDVIASSSI